MLIFLPILMDFNPHTHAVHVVGRYEGHKVEVLLSRGAIEYLAGAKGLTKDSSFTTVVKNKVRLEHAAEVALARHGEDCLAVTVELVHLALIVPVLPETLRARAGAA